MRILVHIHDQSLKTKTTTIGLQDQYTFVWDQSRLKTESPQVSHIVSLNSDY